MNGANRWQAMFEQALNEASGECFGDLVFDFGLEILGEDHFPAVDFESLLRIMLDRRFHALENAWQMITVFNYEWESLTNTQQDRLLVVLEQIYACFSDWMSPFYIAQLVGERFADRRALDVLERLRKTRNQMARAFVPHGLEHVAKRSRESVIANRAIDAILLMRGDLSEQVSGEVDMAIQRLADQGVLGRA